MKSVRLPVSVRSILVTSLVLVAILLIAVPAFAQDGRINSQGVPYAAGDAAYCLDSNGAPTFDIANMASIAFLNPAGATVLSADRATILAAIESAAAGGSGLVAVGGLDGRPAELHAWPTGELQYNRQDADGPNMNPFVFVPCLPLGPATSPDAGNNCTSFNGSGDGFEFSNTWCIEGDNLCNNFEVLVDGEIVETSRECFDMVNEFDECPPGHWSNPVDWIINGERGFYCVEMILLP